MLLVTNGESVIATADLFPSGTPCAPRSFELGVRAWVAFRSPDPSAIEALTGETTSAMPWREASRS